MKLQKVSTYLLKESLIALEDVYRKYKGVPQRWKYAGSNDPEDLPSERCAFCIFNEAQADYTTRQCICPWIWIAGHSCGKSSDEYPTIYKYCTPEENLKRLDHWRILIVDELIRRDIESRKEFQDAYCSCGQYLTTYFKMLGKAVEIRPVTMTGIPCPAKDCKKTYTVEIKPAGDIFNPMYVKCFSEEKSDE